jgi:type VI secretion system protein ImpG
MSTDRLLHYNKELEQRTQLSTEFAQAHPKIAERLGEPIDDPHTARFIEALAFLNADIHRKLVEDLPELQNTLLNTLYPHYQTPIPAMGIVQLTPKQQQKTEFPAGLTLESDPGYGDEVCTFSTCYPVTLWPIDVAHARFTKTCLELTLTCPESITFESLQPDSLRFFINAPREYAFLTYEWLMTQTTAITLDNISLDREALQPVGFDRHEGMLPYTPKTFMGYRLWMEFFNIPEKFLFFDIKDLKKLRWKKTNSLKLVFNFREPQPLLEKHVNASWFALGCTPIVNLFYQHLEPFKFSHAKTEYQLVPDLKRIHQATEIYTVQRVVGINKKQQALEYLQLYSKQQNTLYPLGGYWYAHRRQDMFLTILDSGQLSDMTIHVEALCTNRALPSELPFGGNEPRLLHEKVHVRSLLPLTPTRKLYQEHPTNWQLLAHLITHYLSLFDGEEGAQNLVKILRLYDVNHYELDGLLHISRQPVTHRHAKTRGNAFSEGAHTILEVDEHKFSGSSLFLFGSILEHFLALYTEINSFTQLTLITSNDKKQYQWLPRAGEKSL